MARLPSQAFSFLAKIDGAASVCSGCLSLGFGARTCIATRGMARQRCSVGRRVMFWCANDFHSRRGLGLPESERFSFRERSGFARLRTIFTPGELWVFRKTKATTARSGRYLTHTKQRRWPCGHLLLPTLT